jgi:hypothetical protein
MPPAAASREERNVPPTFCRRQPVLSLLTIAAACCLMLAADKPDRAGGDVKAFVDRRVEEWQPTADERRFDDLRGVINRINDDEHSFLVQSYESRLA